MERLLDVNKCAEILSLSPSTIYALVHQQRIPHVKLGRSLRFRPVDIEKWVKNQSREPTTIRLQVER